MAESEQSVVNIYEDPKKVRAQIKEERKKLRARQKQSLKDIRKKQREMDEREAQYDYTGGGITSFFLTVLIVIMWLFIMALLVRMDIGGFGSTVMAPIVKDVPYLNYILPESARGNTSKKKTSTDDAYVKRLEESLAEAQNLNSQNADTIAELQSELERLRSFEDEVSDLKEKQKEWYDQVLYSDKSPDISTFIKWYESFDKEKASELYKEAIKKEALSEAVKSYAEAYSSMKPQAAAGVFDEMVENGSEKDTALVARILLQMAPDDRGKIMGKMNPENASVVTRLMEPEGFPEL